MPDREIEIVNLTDATVKRWGIGKYNFLPQNHSKPACEWSVEEIIKAMEANLQAEMTIDQHIPSIDLIRTPHYMLVSSNLNDDTFNVVANTRLNTQHADEVIREVVHYFKTRKVAFTWWISPSDTPTDLADRLKQAGLNYADNSIGMYLDLDAWHPLQPVHHLEIKKAETLSTFQDFGHVLVNNADAFEEYFQQIASAYTSDDPFEFFVGYVDGKPVTRGMLVYTEVAGVYYIATSPTHRRQGYAAAMQNFLLMHAKQQGFHIATLQASAEGISLYRKQGFKECCEFLEFNLT